MTNPAAIEAAKRIVSETDSANDKGDFHNTPHDREYVVARALLEAAGALVIETGYLNMAVRRAEKAEAEVSLLKEERALRESIAASQGQRILDVEAELAACERSLLGVKAQRDDALGDLAALRKAVRDALGEVCLTDGCGVEKALRAKVGPHMGEI